MSVGLWPLAFGTTIAAEAAIAALAFGSLKEGTPAFKKGTPDAGSPFLTRQPSLRALAVGWTFAINAVTHPLFWLTAPSFGPHAAWIAAAEITIVLVEALALSLLLTLSGAAMPPRRVLSTVALGNLFSLLLGLFLVAPTALANAPAPEFRTPPPLTEIGSPEFFLALLGLTAAALSGPLGIIMWSKRGARRRGKALWLRLVPAGLVWSYTLHAAVCLAYAGPYALVFGAPLVPILLVVVLPFFAALHGFSARSGNT